MKLVKPAGPPHGLRHDRIKPKLLVKFELTWKNIYCLLRHKLGLVRLPYMLSIGYKLPN